MAALIGGNVRYSQLFKLVCDLRFIGYRQPLHGIRIPAAPFSFFDQVYGATRNGIERQYVFHNAGVAGEFDCHVFQIGRCRVFDSGSG